jgi:hypothetical protein
MGCRLLNRTSYKPQVLGHNGAIVIALIALKKIEKPSTFQQLK